MSRTHEYNRDDYAGHRETESPQELAVAIKVSLRGQDVLEDACAKLLVKLIDSVEHLLEDENEIFHRLGLLNFVRFFIQGARDDCDCVAAFVDEVRVWVVDATDERVLHGLQHRQKCTFLSVLNLDLVQELVESSKVDVADLG